MKTHIQLFNYSVNLNAIIRRKIWITELFCTFVSNSRITRIVSHKKLKEFYGGEIYDTTQQNISLHIENIYKDGEFDLEATHKKYLLVRQEGNCLVIRNIDHNNLNVIIAEDKLKEEPQKAI